MSKQPTPAQDAYIERILGRKRTKKDSKITAQFLSYDRRRGKIQTEVDKIAAGHPLRGTLDADLASAKVKADTGALKGAYQDLQAVKQRARDASRNYFAGLPQEISTGIANASRDIDAIVREHKATQQDMDDLAQEIAAEEKVGDCADLDEAYDRRDELTTEQVKWEGTIDAVRTQVRANATAAANLGIKAKVESLGRLIDAFRKNRPDDKSDQATAGGLVQELAQLEMKTRLSGEYIDGALVTRLFDDRRHQAEGLIAGAMAFGDLQQRAPEPALKKFKALDKRDAKRLRDAKKQMRADAKADARRNVLDGKGAAPAANDYDPDTFAAGDMIDAGQLANLDESEIDDPLIAARAQAAANNLAAAMTQLAPGGDVMFDLALKSPAELKKDLLAELNWNAKDLKQTPQRAKLVDQIARSLYDTATANNPNKMADDESTVTMGGVTYANKEYLTKGGFGKIHRYTDPRTNQSVIVKSMNDPGARKGAVQEMRAHWQAMGGENGALHPNIVELKGTAVSSDGTLHMILEEAKGGDVNSFIKSVQAASDSGLISPEASAALTRRTMQQALQGVKALHKQGLLHLDIKAENFLMAEDGTVKLADFGSAQAPDENTGQVKSKDVTTTEEFAPPELRSGDRAVDRKGEVFWLGSMLQGAASNIGIEGEAQRPENRTGVHEQFDVLRTGHKATAFDRLRNAMLDPDPKKRPTLEGVLLSSYMSDSVQAMEEDDVEALAQSVVNYSKAVGRKVRDIELEINGHRGEIKKQEPEFASGESEISRRGKNEAYEKFRATAMAKIAPLQAKLDAFTKVRSPEEVDALDAEVVALRQELADVSSGAKAGDAAALTQQLAELEDTVANVKKVQPLLRAIADAEAGLRTSETGEFPGGSGVAKKGKPFVAEGAEDEDEDDRLLRERLDEAELNKTRNELGDALNEEIGRARGSPRRAKRQAQENVRV